jgi:hypothetical protein
MKPKSDIAAQGFYSDRENFFVALILIEHHNGRNDPDPALLMQLMGFWETLHLRNSYNV